MHHGSGRVLRELQTGRFHVSDTIHGTGLRLDEHAHAEACFHFVTDGVYVESTCEHTLRIPRGRTLLKPPGLRHWNTFPGECRSLRVDFDPSVVREAGARLPAGLVSFRDGRVGDTSRRLLHTLEQDGDHAPLAVRGLCLQLIAQILDAATDTSPTASRIPDAVQRCREHLRIHFRDSVRFSALARRVGVSRTYLASAFRQHHGCTMGDFVRRLRVEYAISQLESTDRTLADIALDAGFADQSHLTRVFRSLTGTPPGRWRAHRVAEHRFHRVTTVQDGRPRPS